MSRSRWWCPLLATVLMALPCWPALVAAQAEEEPEARRAVLVRPIPEELQSRIAGQTGDLEWEIVPVDRPPSDDGFGFVEALELAQENDVRVVIWFVVRRSSLTVHVADAEQRRLFARELDARPGARASRDSALLETAAVMIRSTLQALSLGGEIGVAMPAPPPPPPAPPPAPAGPPEPSGPYVELVADLGWALAWDGESLPGQHGPSLAVGAGVSRVLVRLGFVAGLRQDLDDDIAHVTIGRHALRMIASVLPIARDDFRLELGAAGGAAIYRRTTGETAPGYAATDDRRHAAGMVGLLARLAWYPGRAHAVGLSLSAGADAVLPAPLLQYEQAGMVVNRNDFWVFQPWTAVEVEIRAR